MTEERQILKSENAHLSVLDDQSKYLEIGVTIHFKPPMGTAWKSICGFFLFVFCCCFMNEYDKPVAEIMSISASMVQVSTGRVYSFIQHHEGILLPCFIATVISNVYQTNRLTKAKVSKIVTSQSDDADYRLVLVHFLCMNIYPYMYALLLLEWKANLWLQICD